MQMALASLTENVPPAHASHAPDPFTALYVPSSHATHGPPSIPVYPASHLQSVALILPAEDDDLEGHATHVKLF